MFARGKLLLLGTFFLALALWAFSPSPQELVSVRIKSAGAQGPPKVVLADNTCGLPGGSPLDIQVFFASDTPWDAAWIDLSLQDNGFAPGTFSSAGPFAAEYRAEALPNRRFQNSYVWKGLNPPLTQDSYYLRVNLRYGSRWYPSATHTLDLEGLLCPEQRRWLEETNRGLGADDLESRVSELERRTENLQGCVNDFMEDVRDALNYGEPVTFLYCY